MKFIKSGEELDWFISIEGDCKINNRHYTEVIDEVEDIYFTGDSGSIIVLKYESDIDSYFIEIEGDTTIDKGHVNYLDRTNGNIFLYACKDKEAELLELYLLELELEITIYRNKI